MASCLQYRGSSTSSSSWPTTTATCAGSCAGVFRRDHRRPGGLKNVMEAVSSRASQRQVLLLNRRRQGDHRQRDPLPLPRARGPGRINCGAIPDRLIDSKLFGQEKAPSPAPSQTRAFRTGDKGAIFSTVGDLPPRRGAALQVLGRNRAGGDHPIRWTSASLPPPTAIGSLIPLHRFRGPLVPAQRVPYRIPPLGGNPHPLVLHFII